MADDSQNERYSAFEHGFIVPIAGLLSLVFAAMAGGTLFSAATGSVGAGVLTVIFAGASVLFFYVRKRRIETMTDESDQS